MYKIIILDFNSNYYFIENVFIFLIYVNFISCSFEFFFFFDFIRWRMVIGSKDHSGADVFKKMSKTGTSDADADETRCWFSFFPSGRIFLWNIWTGQGVSLTECQNKKSKPRRSAEAGAGQRGLAPGGPGPRTTHNPVSNIL